MSPKYLPIFFRSPRTVIAFLSLISLSLLQVYCGDTPYQQGKILYNNYCANCHMEDGSGLAGLIPPLAQADYLKENQLYTACIIRYGMEGEIQVNGKTYNQAMDGIGELSEFEITNIINYISHAWGNEYGVVKLENVRAELEACHEEMHDH